jgi:predicted house-cleaning NTP pyrophosphatase (Maf/HAM1 superfamily)
LFEATNVIIGIDKKCYLLSRIWHKSGNHNNNQKSFNKIRAQQNQESLLNEQVQEK